jgi:hypothetical protein
MKTICKPIATVIFRRNRKKELSSDESSTIQRRRSAGVIFLALGILLWLLLAGLYLFKGTGYLVQNTVLLICPGPGGLVLLLASIFILRSTSTVKENYQLKKGGRTKQYHKGRA